MKSAFFLVNLDHWQATWLRRAKELVFWRKHKYAWRSGYGSDGAGIVEYSFEAYIRILELLGFGLAYSALEALFAGHRYRSLSPQESAFAKTYFTDAELVNVRLDEGARYIAGTLKIAFVAGFVVKTNGRFHRRLLIHELVHIRQFKRWGWAYAAKALMAQWTGSGYDVPLHLAFPQPHRAISAITFEHGPKRGESFHPALNAEQEARRLENTVGFSMF